MSYPDLNQRTQEAWAESLLLWLWWIRLDEEYAHPGVRALPGNAGCAWVQDKLAYSPSSPFMSSHPAQVYPFPA